MRSIINIPEKIEEYIKDYIPIGAGDNVFCYPDEIARMIQNGTPIPDNATNGETIKAMFPNTEIMITDERVFLRDGTIVMIFPLRWWNAPYQKGKNENIQI